MEVLIEDQEESKHAPDAKHEARVRHKELPSLASLASARAMVAKPRNDYFPVTSYHSLEMRRNVPYRNKRKAGRVIISHRMPRTAATGKPNANQAQNRR